MNTLAISVTRQAGGLTFSLKPLVRQQLHQQFPEAAILPSIFVSYTAKQDVASLLERLAAHIPPAITGLTNEELKQLRQIVFVDSQTGGILFDSEYQAAA